MSLWAFVCSVHLCFSVRKRTHPRYEIRPMRLAAEFVLSQRTFFSLTELTDLTEPFCALFRSHRTPPAYRVHRGLSAIIITNKGHNEAYILFIGVSRWLRPSLLGRGRGRGRYLSDTCVFCSSVFSVRKNMSFSICHYVIMSKKTHLSPFVIMSFCLKNHICYFCLHVILS